MTDPGPGSGPRGRGCVGGGAVCRISPVGNLTEESGVGRKMFLHITSRTEVLSTERTSGAGPGHSFSKTLLPHVHLTVQESDGCFDTLEIIINIK